MFGVQIRTFNVLHSPLQSFKASTCDVKHIGKLPLLTKNTHPGLIYSVVNRIGLLRALLTAQLNCGIWIILQLTYLSPWTLQMRQLPNRQLRDCIRISRTCHLFMGSSYRQKNRSDHSITLYYPHWPLISAKLAGHTDNLRAIWFQKTRELSVISMYREMEISLLWYIDTCPRSTWAQK